MCRSARSTNRCVCRRGDSIQRALLLVRFYVSPSVSYPSLFFDAFNLHVRQLQSCKFLDSVLAVINREPAADNFQPVSAGWLQFLLLRSEKLLRAGRPTRRAVLDTYGWYFDLRPSSFSPYVAQSLDILCVRPHKFFHPFLELPRVNPSPFLSMSMNACAISSSLRSKPSCPTSVANSIASTDPFSLLSIIWNLR